MNLFKVLIYVLFLRLVQENVGMDIPFAEGVLSPVSTEMRPGKEALTYYLYYILVPWNLIMWQ